MSENEDGETISFAIVVGDEVAGTITFGLRDDRPVVKRQIAAFLSDPKIIECTGTEGIRYGWKWDGQNFINPQA